MLICADDIARGKPDPEGYLTAAQRLGVAPLECVVIEDAPAGLAAARAAGMRAIGIGGTYSAAALSGADFVVEKLSALHVTIGPSGASLQIDAHGGDVAGERRR